jgi:hypothetical protein
MNANWKQSSVHTAWVVAGLISVTVATNGCHNARMTAQQPLVCSFDGDAVGSLPPGWSQHHLGEGTTRWAVVESDSGRALAQLATPNPNKHFNIAVLDSTMVADVTLSVRFKAVSGAEDQGGGFVWRYQDERNHYIVRANPLENNVVLYKMENGVRTDLPLEGAGRTYGVKVDPLGQEWHALGLHATGDRFAVLLDGRELFQVRDSTFTEPGRVGLWTKADAVTEFDDFSVHSP